MTTLQLSPPAAPPGAVPPGRAQPTGAAQRTSTPMRIAAIGVLLGVLSLIAWHVVRKTVQLHPDSLTGLYTILISGYVLSRFALAALYRPPKDVGLEPECAVIVPAYNESEAVARTIHALMALDYPASKLEIVVINDGSSDDTWEQMTKAAAQYEPGRVRLVDLGSNQGKRAAMAAGIRATSAEILVFVDSDSVPAPDGLRRLVQGFADERVGAISGLTYVRNVGTNVLTRMQAARYYISYQLLKAAESALGAVACCSGCFAAYRRVAVIDLLEGWEHQRFLGVECTYGDDRALTNMVLRSGWTTIYDARAEAWTDAPEHYRKFFKQQLRWKKSWAREGPLLLSHVWRTRLRAFPSVLVNTIAGLLSPVIIVWNLIHPFAKPGVLPVVYALGLYLVSMAYGLLYRALRRDGLWRHAFLGTFFYVAFSAQLLWAIVRIRDGQWGTRDLQAVMPNGA